MSNQKIDNNDLTLDKLKKWNSKDTTWALGCFGTAIGAGVLFFPIRAGYGGLLPILIMLAFAYPIAFLCHRALARLCLSGKNVSDDITVTIENHFGKTGGIIMTFLYFFAICPLLWIYGVTLTNTFTAFWINQLGMSEIPRSIVALVALLILAVIIRFGRDIVMKVMSYLVFPFITCLFIISIALIPYWNSSVFETFSFSSFSLFGADGILVTVWLGIAMMVFSFNFSPFVSSLVVAIREEYEEKGGRELAEEKTNKILAVGATLMVVVVMFFAFSCLFTLSPANMIEAKAQNIPVLSYLANYFGTLESGSGKLVTFFEYGAPIIALVAVFKSFFGHYLGTLEGLNGLIVRFGYDGDRTKISVKKLNYMSMVVIMGSTWLIAYLNPNILDLIEAMGAPIIACLLCLLPMYAVNKVPAMSKFKGLPSNIFVTLIGLLTILNIIYKLF